MLISIANFLDADRRSAVSAENMPVVGAVCLVVPGSLVGGSTGPGGETQRYLTRLITGTTNVTAGTSMANVNSATVAVALKVSKDPYQVTTTTLTPQDLVALGDRRVTIASGDQIIEVRRGSILEYDASLLDASLDPARGGTLPVVGQSLGVIGTAGATAGLWSTVGASGALTTKTIGRCYGVVNGKVRIELVEVQ